MYLVSFKLYDVDHDGYLTKPELERVLLKLVKKKIMSSPSSTQPRPQSSTFSKEDKTTEIQEMVDQLFKDFDVDNDDRLVRELLETHSDD